MRLWIVLVAACAPREAGSPDAGDVTIDATCGGRHLDVTYVAPDVLFALDRSCSMNKALTGTSTTKWEAAVAAIGHVVTKYDTTVRWGLTLFPDTTGASCAQDTIPIPIGAGHAAAIDALLTNALAKTDPLYPSGPCVTNIDTGVQQAATDPGLADTTRPNYVMLVTDGAQSSGCSLGGGAAGAVATVADLHDHRGVSTFVVGFGSEVDDLQLTELANAGGKALPGTPAYYKADTADTLDAALQSVTSQVASCSYHVDPPPPDLNLTYVVFDGHELVPRDTAHASGWDFDAATGDMTVYGSYCDRVMHLQVTSIDVTYGCPSPPIL
jgi:hypothetical protein